MAKFSGPISFSKENFEINLNKLKHRGPDDGNIFTTKFGRGQIYLGHRRLSIIDLESRSRGLMQDWQKRVVVTFNGEIYNYKDLKKELIKLGSQFQTESDTEIILEAYKIWGPQGFSRLNGMFAFALVDLIQNKLFLVRDRLGIKPLYYSFDQGSIYFSSELKGLLSFGLEKKLDLPAISSFLSYRHVLGEKTYFQNIKNLGPGTFISWDGFSFKQETYWSLTLGSTPFNFLSPGKISKGRDEIAHIFGTSVKEHTLSDIPLGAFLSGGLDSTLILSEMCKISKPESIQTFTVSFDEEGYDETFYARLASNYFGAKNTLLKLSSFDCFDKVRELIRFKDQPLGMHNEVALYLMARELKKHVSVVLSGEGSDELFSGYGQLFRSPFDLQRLNMLKVLPHKMQRPLSHSMGLNFDLMNLGRLQHFLKMYSYFPQEEKISLFNESMKKEINNDQYTNDLFALSFKESSHRPYYDQINYAFVKHHLPGLLLMMDSTSMAASVEVRVPFLDHRLVEASFRLPYSEKLKWKSPGHFLRGIKYPAKKISEKHDTTKYVLRTLYKSKIPQEIIERKKMVFPVPLTEWFSQKFSQTVEKELLISSARIGEFFDLKKLRVWNEQKRKNADQSYGRQLWLMLNLEYWMQDYL